jgi:hypothetical protein
MTRIGNNKTESVLIAITALTGLLMVSGHIVLAWHNDDDDTYGSGTGSGSGTGTASTIGNTGMNIPTVHPFVTSCNAASTDSISHSGGVLNREHR